MFNFIAALAARAASVDPVERNDQRDVMLALRGNPGVEARRQRNEAATSVANEWTDYVR